MTDFYVRLFRNFRDPNHEIFRQIGAGVLQEVLQVGCLVVGINGGLIRPIFNDHKLIFIEAINQVGVKEVSLILARLFTRFFK